MVIDLHIHSCFSDGTQTIAEIVDRCKQKGVQYASLTDHDTASGVSEFLRLCGESDIKAISGIEFSTMDKREVHILGYGMDINGAQFCQFVDSVQQMRVIRNQEIIKKLRKQKIYINFDMPTSNAQIVGRMHIARELKRAGYVGSENEAFTRLLGMGRSAYVPSKRIATEDAIRAVKSFGGKAILAHPLNLQMSMDNLKAYILKLKEVGLDGIESFYATHTEHEKAELYEFALQNDLLQTAGSDYHGEGRACDIADCDSSLITQQMLGKLFN